MSIGTNRQPASQFSSDELFAKARDYTERGMDLLAESAKRSAERLKKQGR